MPLTEREQTYEIERRRRHPRRSTATMAAWRASHPEAAHAARAREREADRDVDSLATQRRRAWTREDIAIIRSSPGEPARSLALRLGRTARAMEGIRRRLRRTPHLYE